MIDFIGGISRAYPVFRAHNKCFYPTGSTPLFDSIRRFDGANFFRDFIFQPGRPHDAFGFFIAE